jgi:hypothetical protein
LGRLRTSDFAPREIVECGDEFGLYSCSLERRRTGASRDCRESRLPSQRKWLTAIAAKLDPRPNTAAVRQHRERMSNGRRVIGRDEEELLREMKLLKEWDCDDRKAVGRAIEKLLAVIRAERG